MYIKINDQQNWLTIVSFYPSSTLVYFYFCYSGATLQLKDLVASKSTALYHFNTSFDPDTEIYM